MAFATPSMHPGTITVVLSLLTGAIISKAARSRNSVIQRSVSMSRGQDLASELRHDTPAFLASYYYTLKCPHVNSSEIPYATAIIKAGTKVDILTCEHDVPRLKPHDRHLVLVKVEVSAVNMVQPVRSWGSSSSTDYLPAPVTGKQVFVDKKAVRYLFEQDEERQLIFGAGPQTPPATYDFQYTVPVGCEDDETCCQLRGERSSRPDAKPTYYKCGKNFLLNWMSRCVQADDWACSHEYEDFLKAENGDSNGSDSDGSDSDDDDDIGRSLGALDDDDIGRSLGALDLRLTTGQNATRSVDF